MLALWRPSVYDFIATIATSVRFLAFNFLMTLRTWTFTVLKDIFISLAMALFDLPCWIARTTESSRAVGSPSRNSSATPVVRQAGRP